MPSRYRAEIVGSLLRPAELLQARAAFAGGRIGQEELREKEDRAILAALRRQAQIGLEICSDGEMRRASWLADMADAVEGFVPNHTELEWHGPGGGKEGSKALVAGAKLRKARKLTAHEFPFLRQNARHPFKITLPAPSNFMLASFKAGVTDKFYPNEDALLEELVAIIHDEIQWLASEGATYIQLDAPFYSHYFDQRQRDRMRQTGTDPDREFEKAISADNASLKGIARANLTLAIHVCRGNSRSRWYAEGSYDAIAEKLFGLLDVDTFLLEYDDERSGGFEPLRLVPGSKTAVLGLITTKEPTLESERELLRRIDEAARFIPLESLALSTQCGFASVDTGNLLSEDNQWKKLELVVSTARKAWASS